MTLNINLRSLTSYLLVLDFLFLLVGKNLFDRKVLFFNFLVFLFVNRYRLTKVIAINGYNWTLWVVILWCAVSSLWSQWFFLSVEETIFQIILVLTCSLITNYFTFDELIKSLQKALYIVIVINILAILITPGTAISEVGVVGITNHKNQLGLLMALATIFLFFLENKTKLSKVMMCISFFLLLLSLSKTSLILTCITIFAASFFAKRKPDLSYFMGVRKLLVIFSIILFFSMVAVWRYEILYFLHNNLDPEGLTGRIGLWLTMLYHAEGDLLIGFGFNSVWGKEEFSEIYFTDLFISSPLWVEVLSASDGGYIDLTLAIGLVGVSLFVVFMAQFYFNIYCARKENMRVLLFAVLVFVSLHNITETSFLLSTNVLWFLFVLGSFFAASARINRNGN